MGKDDKKEESGFGFKDAAKAQETLRLLEQHEPNYRRLTVRGLLGRAKRVLTMTKAEDKVRNIKEAMAVFEQWLADLEASKGTPDKKVAKKVEKKKDSSESEDGSLSDVDMDKPPQQQQQRASLPSDTVPGLGFKDAGAARASLAALQGRDPEYARLAVKGLIGRAKRVLTCTRDETKISNMKAAMAIFDEFLDEFESQHLSRQNNAYLSLGIVRTAEKLAGDDVSEQQRSFIAAYSSVRGEYKRLRTVSAAEGDKTWDIVRNTALKELKEKYAEAKLFTDKDAPTPEHIQMLLWAYSPEPARTKKYVPETHEDRKRRRDSSSDDKRDGKRQSDSSEDKTSDGKRRRESSSDEQEEGKRRSSEESPAKKSRE